MSPRPSLAELNDVFRRTFLTGRVVITDGVAGLPEEVREEIITKVRGFDDFCEDNDPYGEHDFGAFDQPGAGKVFWKIDYYDKSLRFGSEDPADPSKTTRVLTILLAEEW